MEVPASAVAFGTVIVQLGAVAVRLKRLWDEIANVPERIQESLAEIEHLGLLFAEMENSIQDPAYPNLPSSFWTGPLMQLSLNRAKQALDALQSVTDDLDSRLKNAKSTMQRKLVAIRGIMDKEKIRDLQAKLARSVDLLWKSHDLASNRLLRETVTRCVAQTIRSEMITVSGNNTHYPRETLTEARHTVTGNVATSHNRQHSVVSKTHARTLFRCRFPSWWSTTVWEVCSAPLPGWNYGLRVYNIVPRDSEIFKSVLKGDMAAVIRLLQTGKASIYDQNQFGTSLLQAAVGGLVRPRSSEQGQEYLRLITALLDWGLHDTLQDRPWSAFDNLLDTLLRKPDGHALAGEVFRLFWRYQPSLDSWPVEFEVSNAINDGTPPSYHDLTLCNKFIRIRIQAAPYPFSFSSKFPDPTWISKDGTVNAAQVALSIEQGTSLFHSAALALGAYRGNPEFIRWKVDGVPNQSNAADELLAAVAAVCSPQELHHCEDFQPGWTDTILWTGTPLISLLGGFLISFTTYADWFHDLHRCTTRLCRRKVCPKSRDQILQRTLVDYACSLQAAGVELLAYGQREHRLFHDNMSTGRQPFDADSAFYASMPTSRTTRIIAMRLVDLEFGAEPEQWKLIWEHDFEALAREFWELIERAPVLMPGSWVD